MVGFFVLQAYLARAVKTGKLTIIDADNKTHEFGDGSGPPITVRLKKKSLYWRLILFPDPSVGEAFMDGSLQMIEGSIYDLMVLLASQPDSTPRLKWNVINFIRLHGWRPNKIGKARRNVAHHYDLSRQLFELFLDDDLQYSCAYYEHPNVSLESAQLAKKQHIAAKLNLKPGMKVLDIGSGFGGMAIYLAETCDVAVVGVTLSEEQYKLSCQKCVDRGLQDKVTFKLLDYRKLDETFDRIVSVGMFEHVGVQHYSEYFGKLDSLLAKDGIALIHTIGRLYGPQETSRWITKYIFPGGVIPAFSEIAPAVERSMLIQCDHEILRLHYALTLAEWRSRFMKNRKRAQLLYDERFCRMWEFYLASSETSFRYDDLVVFQLQLSKNLNTLPITRTYQTEEEKRLASHYPKLKHAPDQPQGQGQGQG